MLGLVKGRFAKGDHALHISEIFENSDDQWQLEGSLVPYGDEEPGPSAPGPLVRTQIIVEGKIDHFESAGRH